MNKIMIQYFNSTAGELILGTFHDKLCLCDWRFRNMRQTIDKRIQEGLNASYGEGETSIMETVKHQLNEYFSAQRTDFDIPLLMVGSAFQKSVWNELLMIPYGKTESYLGLSRKIGHEKAIRSVAAANGANAIAIIIPCHRIIGSDGKLTGYAGGLQAKRKLLQLEMHKHSSEQLTLFN
jgi:methylated-DNA-[protein]-cysteine S-methyltransferase